MKPKIIAFYLPQFHPIKENNEWFGKGFTEWTNVAMAKPLFRGHVQPKVPSDLGFYDLRIPAVREEQALLAAKAGIYGFCYYHYWFGNGRTLLEQPLQEVTRSGKPNFPFCVCWANHSWYKKNWNPREKKIEQNLIMKQEYPGNHDIIDHFNFLKDVFKDSRYIKVHGKLLFVIYNPLEIVDFNVFKNIWNKLAKENGLPEFYFVGYTNYIKDLDDNSFKNYDANILCLNQYIQNKTNSSHIVNAFHLLKTKISEILNQPLYLYSYKNVMHKLIHDVQKRENVIPIMLPNWDYTPRRGAGGLILKNCCPQLFKEHALQILKNIKNKDKENQIVFIKSWNEWGEGNYMEPDMEYGQGYIEALRDAINQYD